MSKIKLHSGIMFDFLNPTIESILLEDILHNLSKEQRYGNCLSHNWTVLQHSLLVTKITELTNGSYIDQYQALHHDDGEAYCLDLPTPFKNLLPNYKIIYNDIEKVIGKKFNIQLDPKFHKVKQADKITLLIEDVLFSPTDSDWHLYDIKTYYEQDQEEFDGEIDKYISELYTEKDYQLKQRYMRLHNKLRNKLNYE